MRPALAAATLALLAVAATLPAEAAPLPKTREMARGLLHDAFHDALDEADRTAAAAAREAELLVAALRATAARNGALDVRAMFTQPVVHGSGDPLSVLWTAGDARGWRGAYWIDTSAGATTPNVVDLREEGALFFLGERPLGPLDHVDVTYHFLGLDGKHHVVRVGRAPILAFAPLPQAPDLGGAASARIQGDLAGVFLSPWNLLDRDATLGITLSYASGASEELLVESCAEPASHAVEAGCRQLYALPAATDLERVTLWHLAQDGARVDDRTLTLAELDAGHTFGL